MSVSAELLCSFELLKPLDSSALKSHIKKGRSKRQQMLNSPVSFGRHYWCRFIADVAIAGGRSPSECLRPFTKPRTVLALMIKLASYM